MLGHGIHDVLIHAVGAGGFPIVPVNILSKDVAKQGSCFGDSFSARHDDGGLVMDEDGTVFGDVDRFYGRFP